MSTTPLRLDAIPASFVVWQKAGVFYARDMTTGEVFPNADAAAALQWAINRLPNDPAGKLYVKEGDYALSTVVTISKNLILEGAGEWAYGTRFYRAAGTAFDVTASNVKVSHIYVDGNNRAAHGIHVNGLLAGSGGYVTLENCMFYRCDDGVQLEGSLWGHIYRDLHFDECDTAINCLNTTTDFQAYMCRVWVANPHGTGVVLRNLNGCSVFNLEIMCNPPSGAGLELIGWYGGRSVFVDTIAENCGLHALYVANVKFLEFDDCLFSTQSGIGDVPAVEVDEWLIGDNPSYVQLLGGYFNSRIGGGDVVKIANSREVKILGAIIRSETVTQDNRAGVKVQDSYRCEVKACTFYGGQYGVLEVGAAENDYYLNHFRGVNTPASGLAATSKIKTNRGYVTENYGVATMLAANVKVTFPHGLYATLVPLVVKLTGSHPEVSRLWVESKDATNITVVSGTTLTEAHVIYWNAEV